MSSWWLLSEPLREIQLHKCMTYHLVHTSGCKSRSGCFLNAYFAQSIRRLHTCQRIQHTSYFSKSSQDCKSHNDWLLCAYFVQPINRLHKYQRIQHNFYCSKSILFAFEGFCISMEKSRVSSDSGKYICGSLQKDLGWKHRAEKMLKVDIR